MKKKVIWFIVLSVPIMAYSQVKDGRISIGTRDSLRSEVLNETRPYWVYLPQSYAGSLFKSGKYPVLYLLDGDAHFHSVSGLMQILGSGINGTYVIPDMIVVAIPNTDRTRDLTPTHLDKVDGEEHDWLKNSGGGNNFLRFLRDELIPHIDSTYRTMPYRVLVGHSFGGIAVINALFTMPETFNAYLSIDPSLWWDQQILVNKGKEYFQNADLKGRMLFIAQANTLVPLDSTINKHFESIKEFAMLLETRNRSGLKWAYKYYENDSHGSVPLIAEYDGLRFFFKHYNPDISRITSPEQLKKHYLMLSEEMKATFLPLESIVNALGYNAMAARKYDLAQQYFQMNIDVYPQSANVYDSMGELWGKKGDTKKAIDYYEKSLQLNPNNESARNYLKKLKAALPVRKQ